MAAQMDKQIYVTVEEAAKLAAKTSARCTDGSGQEALPAGA